MAGSKMIFGQYEFKPVPLFSWATETVYDSKQDKTYLKHTVDCAGTILELAGESGNLGTLITDRNTLKNALAAQNAEWKLWFNNIPYISGVYPKVSNFSVEQGIWVDNFNYTFTFEYDEDFYSKHIQSYTESWSYEENEDRETITVKHDISAVGLNTTPSGVNNAFTNAKTYVLARTGYNNAVANLPGFTKASGSVSAYEALRSEQADVGGAAYSVAENFILSSGTYIHTSTGQLSKDENDIGTVSVDGEIRGLGRSTLAYTRAKNGWNVVKTQLPAIASGVYSELGGLAKLFTTNYQSYSVTKNPIAGSIAYSISFTDSAKENLPSGVTEFSINVQDNKPVRVYASFPIMDRSLGNVVQDVGTSTEGQFTISGNCVGKTGYPFADLLNYVQTKINEKRPLPASYATLRLNSKQISKDEENNKVDFSVEWIYTIDLSQVGGAGFVVIN